MNNIYKLFKFIVFYICLALCSIHVTRYLLFAYSGMPLKDKIFMFLLEAYIFFVYYWNTRHKFIVNHSKEISSTMLFFIFSIHNVEHHWCTYFLQVQFAAKTSSWSMLHLNKSNPFVFLTARKNSRTRG